MRPVPWMTRATPSVSPQRLWVRTDGAPRADGTFVLYWMHHALRFHENPALVAACDLARELGLPLLVYQGLNADYAGASDRVHTFLLESARNAAEEAAERGFRHVFRLETSRESSDHLVTLADAAAVVVTERVPVDPTESYARRSARRTRTPWIEVDTSCLCPMGTFDAAHDRAFAFRDAARHAWRQALTSPLPEPAPPAPWTGELPFVPIDLARASIADLVAACDIDHGISPIPSTPGGSRAGYIRFDTFLTDRLADYGRDRNDPLADATSRISPYLHVGCVAPWRLARRAAAVDGPGAEKWIDELLTWRELAWHWCHHHPTTPPYELLPAWARSTLAAHAADPRDMKSRRTLERGTTGDALWDAAATSLLRQGELHNNLRMTWVKALPFWRPDAEDAFRTAIALNNTLSLDGRDPASIGGIGWGFGLFDRPHAPESPVLGTVRTRPRAVMARLTDPVRLAERARRPLVDRKPRVAVVGAGLAGLRAADVLDLAGIDVVVFDKGRVPGGRLTTRRSEGSACDHGAPAIESRHPRFTAWCDSLAEDGLLDRDLRRSRFVRADGTLVDLPSDAVGWRPRGGFGDFAASLASTLDVRCGVVVRTCRRDDHAWSLTFDDASHAGPFDGLLLTAPAPQSAAMLGDECPLTEPLSRNAYVPCVTAMVTTAGGPDPEADLLTFESEILERAVRGHTAATWVLHATPAFSRLHLDDDPDASARLLLDEWALRMGSVPATTWFRAHRWRYARVALPASTERCLILEDTAVAVAGDAFAGGDAEGAWLSGEAAAARLRDALFARRR